MKVCKQCGTENDEDFIWMNGKGSRTNICTKCFSDKNREQNTGKNNPNFGKKQSPESCKKRSNALKGDKSPMYGTKQPQYIKDKISKSIRGEKHPFYHKVRSPEHCSNISKSLKHTLEEFKEKYPLVFLMNDFREAPHEIGKSLLQSKCKKCENWFTLTSTEFHNRVRYLEENKDNSYFYCSDECKYSCELFNLKPNHYINNLNRLDNEPFHKTPEYGIFRKEVFNRQLIQENIQTNHCEMCNSESNLHVHHEHPVKTHPHLALDPDNGIILCHICHNKIGHSGECSTASLANKICK